MAKIDVKNRTAKMERSFDGLRDTLFDQLDSLLSGTGKPEVANAVARCAAEITKSVSIQADIMRLAATKTIKNGATISGMSLLR